MNLIILLSIAIIAIILVIVAVLIIIKKPQPKTQSKKSAPVTKNYIDFDDLMDIVKNPNTSSEKLLETLKIFNNNFVIDSENEQKYLIFLSRILTHKNVSKDVFQYFHKDLKSKNKNYKIELEAIERKALG